MTKSNLPPYADRSDVQKIRSQWTKLTGLHGRDEPSAAIVRATTAVELSLNLAIRAEFAAQSKLSDATVDLMLRRANGLRNKMRNLLVPLVTGGPKQITVKNLCKVGDKINDARNDIVHSGYFSNRADATNAIETCRTFINDLVALYEPGFDLARLVQEALEDSSLERKEESKREPATKKLKKSKG